MTEPKCDLYGDCPGDYYSGDFLPVVHLVTESFKNFEASLIAGSGVA